MASSLRSPRVRPLWPLLATAAAVATWCGTHTTLGNPFVRFAAVVATVCGMSVLVVLPGVAALSLAGRPRHLSVRFSVLALGSGVSALVVFWAWVASPSFGRILSIALLAVSTVVIAAVRPTALFDDPELAHALLLGVLLALGFAGFAYLGGGLGGTRFTPKLYYASPTSALAFRYWLAPDSYFPLLFAERVAAHVPLHIPLAADWHTSDRPPLQTALLLMVLPFVGRTDFAYAFFGIVLQATWVPALFVLLVSRGVRAPRLILVIVATALTGAIFINTVYVWPKMLAGALALAALAVLLDGGSLVLAAAVATLALVAHGSIAFSIIVLVGFAWRLRPRLWQAAAAVGVAAVIYAPWTLYQRFIDPPGNRLLKWELAGIIAPDHNSFLHDLVHQYAQDPWRTLVLDKIYNVKMLLGDPSTWRSFTATPEWHGFFGVARTASINSIVLASGPLLFGLFALFSRRARISLRPALPLFWFVVASVVIWVLLLFGGQRFRLHVDLHRALRRPCPGDRAGCPLHQLSAETRCRRRAHRKLPRSSSSNGRGASVFIRCSPASSCVPTGQCCPCWCWRSPGSLPSPDERNPARSPVRWTTRSVARCDASSWRGQHGTH